MAGLITGASSVCAGGATVTLGETSTIGIWSSSTGSVATINSSGLVTGINAGIDTIKYTVTNGCGTATATHIMLVNPLPYAGSISGPASVCAAGGTITLTDSAAGGNWSSATTTMATISSSGVVTGVSPGTVVISYTVVSACGSATATRTITVSPLPSAGTITGASSLCQGASVTLGDIIAGGVWSSGSFTVLP